MDRPACSIQHVTIFRGVGELKVLASNAGPFASTAKIVLPFAQHVGHRLGGSIYVSPAVVCPWVAFSPITDFNHVLPKWRGAYVKLSGVVFGFVGRPRQACFVTIYGVSH